MRRGIDREIARLALPAFLALVAEPLFLLADAAIVGHLGTAPLAGLGVAGVVLQSIVGICVFLAYGTTASVARRVGAGDQRGALSQGIDGLWLAIVIGVAITIPTALGAEQLVRLVGAEGEVVTQGATYLRIAALGITPLLIMLAGNGVLRGLQDTRTPLVVAVGANLVNIVLNLALVYGLDLGIGGSALGSVLAQALGAAAFLVVVVRGARRHQVGLRPDGPGIRAAARGGVALVIRTITLRVAILLTAFAVTLAHGPQAANLAAYQIAGTLWTFLAFALDAIAIAAQALTGRALGAGDRALTRELTNRMILWGAVSGVVTGLLLAASIPWVGHGFTSDPAVLELLPGVLLIAAISQPLCGVVFVLDGVLIGAGDGRYLAAVGLLLLGVYAPLVLLWHPTLAAVWAAFNFVFLGGRFLVLTLRARTETWMRVGAAA